MRDAMPVGNYPTIQHDPDAQAIARRLTKAQRASTEAIMEACCGDPRCWAEHDVDGWLPPGCAKCGAMVPRVRAALAEMEGKHEQG